MLKLTTSIFSFVLKLYFSDFAECVWVWKYVSFASFLTHLIHPYGPKRSQNCFSAFFHFSFPWLPMSHSGAPALSFPGCLKYIGGSDCKWMIENTCDINGVRTHTIYFLYLLNLFSFPCCSLPPSLKRSQQVIFYFYFKPPPANPEVFAFGYLKGWLGVVIKKHLHNLLLSVIIATDVISWALTFCQPVV